MFFVDPFNHKGFEMSSAKPKHRDERTRDNNVKQVYNQWCGWIDIDDISLYPWVKGNQTGDTVGNFRWVQNQWIHANLIPEGIHAMKKQREWRTGQRYKQWITGRRNR